MPSCTKYTRELVTCVSALASELLAQAPPPASSLPRRQLKEPNHVGQPVPRYSTVLLDVKPQVDRDSVPPRGSASLRVMRYTRRGPGAKEP